MEFFPLCVEITEQGLEIEYMRYFDSITPPQDMKTRVVNTWDNVYLARYANGTLHIEGNPTIYRKDMISGREEVEHWMWWRAPYPAMRNVVDIPLPENVQDAIYQELKKYIPVCTDPEMTGPRKHTHPEMTKEQILLWHYQYPTTA